MLQPSLKTMGSCSQHSESLKSLFCFTYFNMYIFLKPTVHLWWVSFFDCRQATSSFGVDCGFYIFQLEQKKSFSYSTVVIFLPKCRLSDYDENRNILEWSCSDSLCILSGWASVVAQWKRICLPMQEMSVWSLGWEDPRRRKWQPPPVLLPGESHGQRRATVLGVAKESDMTEGLNNNTYVLLPLCSAAHAQRQANQDLEPGP